MTEVNATDGTDVQTLSVTVTGDDRPGVTGTLLGALSGFDADVLDIQQVVVNGHLTLTVLLRPGAHVDQLRDAAAVAAHRLGLTLTAVEGTGVNARSRQGARPSSCSARRSARTPSPSSRRGSPTTAPTSTASVACRATP